MINGYYNILALATFNLTIEELILEANQGRFQPGISRTSLKAIEKLLGISKAFLLAEWMSWLIEKATADRNEAFFKAVSAGLQKDIPKDRLSIARTWLAVILLWYLGGNEIHPRKLFLHLLIQKGLVPRNTSIESFKAMLSNLRLTRT